MDEKKDLNGSQKKIPDTTLQTLAKNLYRETFKYGFSKTDYVRFVNVLLDYAMGPEGEKDRKNNNQQSSRKSFDISSPATLPLKGKRIIIRSFDEKSDRKILSEWVKDDKGRQFLISRTTAKKITLNRLLEGEENIIGIITLIDGTPIGAVAFLDYNVQHFRAELRKLIGRKDMRGKGYAKEASEMWIRYGFSTLDLEKIYLNTFDTNIRNIRLNEELGFRVEGILRKEVFVDGEYRDVLRMGLCKEDIVR